MLRLVVMVSVVLSVVLSVTLSVMLPVILSTRPPDVAGVARSCCSASMSQSRSASMSADSRHQGPTPWSASPSHFQLYTSVWAILLPCCQSSSLPLSTLFPDINRCLNFFSDKVLSEILFITNSIVSTVKQAKNSESQVYNLSQPVSVFIVSKLIDNRNK